MANTKLTRTAGTPTNNSKWTVSVWLKRASLAGDDFILDGYVSANDRFKLAFQSANKLEIWNSNGGSDDAKLDSPRVFRDTNAWYHIVLSMDATLSTAADRFKLYVNGTRETEFGSNINPPQNSTEFVVNQNGATISIGDYYGGSNAYDGCMSHFHFIDGTAYDASAFGSTDSTTGEWKINTSPSVTYGNNGFFIFKDNASVTDQSGNSNNFTVSSGTLTQTEDCPSNVFATMNPLIRSSTGTFSQGNNTFTNSSGANTAGFGTIGMFNGQGKYYMEFKGASGSNLGYGISDFKSSGVIQRTEVGENRYVGEYANSYGYYSSGDFYYSGSSTGTGYDSFTSSDVIGMAVDMDNLKIYFHKNGTYQDSKNPASNNGYTIVAPDGAYLPTINVNNASGTVNFGNGFFGTTAISSEGTNASNIGKFEYDVPAGYTALSTKGLNE